MRWLPIPMILHMTCPIPPHPRHSLTAIPCHQQAHATCLSVARGLKIPDLRHRSEKSEKKSNLGRLLNHLRFESLVPTQLKYSMFAKHGSSRIQYRLQWYRIIQDQKLWQAINTNIWGTICWEFNSKWWLTLKQDHKSGNLNAKNHTPFTQFCLWGDIAVRTSWSRQEKPSAVWSKYCN